MTKNIEVITWELPLSKGNHHVDTPSEYLQKLSNASNGFYPMGANSLWHGGIHLDSGTGLTARSAIGCIADGEVIAYRIDNSYPMVTAQVAKSEPVQEGGEPNFQEEKAYFSSGFVLVRHRLNMPSIEGAETPSSQTHSLTFYSLYMHLCHWPFYQANGELPRPAYWGDPIEFEVGEQSKDKISGCVVRQDGSRTPKLALLPKDTVVTIGEPHRQHKGWYQLNSIDEGEALNIPPNTQSVLGYYVYPGEMTQLEGSQYQVAGKLPDSDERLLGQSVYAEPQKAASLLLSVLPRGAKVQIGDKKGRWGKIEKLLMGKAYPALPKNDDGNLQGWIDLTPLTAVIKPLKMGEVKVLDTPHPVKVGELMGYPGVYHALSASEQATDSPLLVHLEVFTPEEMPAFIARTQARAAQQTEDKKTLLKVNRGAVLYQVPTADNDLAADMQVVRVGQSKAHGKWLEVNKQRIGVVDKKYLSHFRSISKKPIKGEYTIGAAHKSSVAIVLNVELAEIPDKVFFYGECLNSAGERVTTTSPGAAHPLREIHFTPKNDTASYWVEATNLDAKGHKIDPANKIPAWSQYPLLADNKPAGTVYFEQVFTRSEIEESEHWAIDPEGAFWWQLKTGNKDSVIGTDSFGEVEGWVRGTAPGVTRHHPWEWPLFHTLQETATPAQKLERNHRLRLDPADRTSLVQTLYKILGGTTRQVADSEEQEDANLLTTENLKTALRYPWLSQQFSHLMVSYESEWFADQGLSKWHELDKMLKKYACQPQGETETADAYQKRLEIELAPWQAEKEQRIKKLLWWDKVAGQHGFPADAKVWHLHPLGMAENFWVSDNDPRWLMVPRGQFTFDVEGNDIEGHRYFSRVAHWPGGASGITLGRGYDLGQRISTLANDLAEVGISGDFYDWLIGAGGLRGDAARKYLENAGPEIRQTKITRKQQHDLFLPIYDSKKDEVIRISASAENVEYYGDLVWDDLDSRMQDMVVDLIYRGDYTPPTREYIQEAIVKNDMATFRAALGNRTIWLKNLPEDRYQRRIHYMR
ncbi:hypothetical protein [Serratia sp. (in: enterobacteria)]|uniref:hypothetical protein n=1 Tax=Serratia sp. (in: enterobacteria) TaxID=616 RepID=UPI0039895049